jgi:hypothetical protein
VSASPLRAALDAVIAEQGCSLKDLTVLAPQNDPWCKPSNPCHAAILLDLVNGAPSA